ncbi:MAG: VTT domain-containing protein [Deltaproteobacteria bacterium]|nr:VTT domain-containing protein [Deltaproteobacteria bacterium]
MGKPRIAEEGVNCWRRIPSHRVAFLFDAGPYYEAFASALERAERAVYVLGWDIDSRVRLRRQPGAAPESSILWPLLNAIVSRKPQLHVYLLTWDYALIYALERERVPLYTLGLRTHRRIHFQFDDRHPPGASHHQKLVVIDDALAFAGGIDLTCHRWDTPSHLPDDPRRVDADGEPFAPFHDMQMAVSGPAARALGDLARQRWYRATRKRLPPVDAPGDPWPPELPADLKCVEVAVARTIPRHREVREAREVERLYLDSIAAARRWLYIENQYLTATSIRDALARRLEEPEGPEIVIVGPRQASGWLENSTMDVLRARVLARLRAADRHGRLRCYYPRLTTKEQAVYVHAKVMVVDDDLLRIGSANLANRSMGLDTECDLALESEGRPEIVQVIRGFRAKLLAEHLGVPPERVAQTLEQSGSLIETVEKLRDVGERELAPLDVEIPEWLDRTIPDEPPFDPPAPLDPERIFEQLVPEEIHRGARGPLLRGSLLLGGLLLLAAAWHWTPVLDWVDPRVLSAWAEPIRGTWIEAPMAVAGTFVGSLVMVPLTLLIVDGSVVFGPWLGFVGGLCGAMLSAASTFWIGRGVGRGRVRWLVGSRVNRISRSLAQRGLLGVIAVRLLPVAAFTAVNLVAGASRVRAWEFLLGTFIGLLPGFIALTVLGGRIEGALRAPSMATVWPLVLTAVVIVALGFAASRWLRKRGRRLARADTQRTTTASRSRND